MDASGVFFRGPRVFKIREPGVEKNADRGPGKWGRFLDPNSASREGIPQRGGSIFGSQIWVPPFRAELDWGCDSKGVLCQSSGLGGAPWVSDRNLHRISLQTDLPVGYLGKLQIRVPKQTPKFDGNREHRQSCMWMVCALLPQSFSRIINACFSLFGVDQLCYSIGQVQALRL